MWSYKLDLLHRGTEKLFEYKNVIQNLPIFWSFMIMYSTMAQEHLLFNVNMNQCYV